MNQNVCYGYSGMSVEILSSLTDQIVTTPMDRVCDNLDHYLMILEAAGRETQIEPKVISHFSINSQWMRFSSIQTFP